MHSRLLELLTAGAVVALVGVVAAGLLVHDMIRREIVGGEAVASRHRVYSIAMAVVFFALVILRFVVRGG